MKLWKKYGTQPRYARIPEDFETMVGNGGALAGSPGTIRDQVRDMAGAAGELFHRPVFLRRSVASGDAALRGHLCPRSASGVAGTCRPRGLNDGDRRNARGSGC
jgi:hypothetical protein